MGKQKFTGKEMTILRKAKYANPYWWRGMIAGADVMPTRAKKYSGDVDPYTNFMIVARLMGCEVREVFQWYIAIKFARAIVSQEDFGDESFLDTLRDLANYTDLWYGWIWREQNGDLDSPDSFDIV